MKRNDAVVCIVVALATASCQDSTTTPNAPQFSKNVKVTVQDLGTFTGQNAFARSINNSGTATGETFGTHPQRAFVWSPRSNFTDLGTLGGLQAVGIAVNERGDVVGFSQRVGSPLPHAFAWTPDEGMIDLLPDVAQRSEAWGVNNGRSVAGTIGSPILLNHEARAFIWTMQDGLTELGNLPGGSGAVARAINARDQIVGEATAGPGNTEIHGFIWSKKDGMRDIGFVGPLPSPTGPFAVNNRGHAAGVKSQNAAAGTRGFLWTPEDGIIEIHPPGALRSFVNGMNDHDQLTGSYVTSLTPLMSRAFFWSAQTGYITLPGLGGPTAAAFGINNSGEIVGRAQTATGQTHAVVWTVR